VVGVRQDLVEGLIVAHRVEYVQVYLLEDTLVGGMVEKMEEDRKVVQIL
jgi:hypothetical protein